MLCPGFKSILKPVHKKYRVKMNQVKTEKNGKTPCTENLNIYLQSGWSVHFMFAYGDVPDPFKMYHGKDCVKKFIEYTEHEVKWLYARFSQQQIKYLTDELKRELEAAENVIFVLKSLMSPRAEG